MPPLRGLFDGFTRIDELLIENTKQIAQLVELMQREENRELKIVFFTYPDDGTYASLSAGIIILDFSTGTINTNGTITYMKHSLQSDGKDFLRSVFIDADKDIVVQLDGQDKALLPETKAFLSTYQQFKKITITTTEATEIFIFCCTNPEAILQLLDTPSIISGGRKMVYGSLIDTDGSGNYFETDQPLGTTPTKYIQLYPTDVKKFRLDSIRYYFEAANSVTFELYLLEASNANDVQSKADVVWDSDSQKARNTMYISLNTIRVPIDVNLTDAGKLYYLVDWSAACGNTPGYLEVRGEKLA